MTRGPPPLKAIAKAKAIATLQGPDMNNPALARSRYGFVLFRRAQATVVLIKRIRPPVSEAAECPLPLSDHCIHLPI
ncbi:hypothetical protein, partial [Methanoregula sp.]|uniref:hypothetical protein n=1 Tax=Methanoregula sp. TaxID=2052170 RepID=UPI000CACC707